MKISKQKIEIPETKNAEEEDFFDGVGAVQGSEIEEEDRRSGVKTETPVLEAVEEILSVSSSDYCGAEKVMMKCRLFTPLLIKVRWNVWEVIDLFKVAVSYSSYSSFQLL